MNTKVDPKTYPIRMEGSYGDDPLYLLAATVEEGMNSLMKADIEFVSNDRSLELRKIVGSQIRIVMDVPTGQRIYPGTCVSIEYLGSRTGPGHYRAEIRPWLWFLARTRNSRILQDVSVPEIVSTILGDHGFSSDLENRLTGSYPRRGYVVQYRESDLDFINRLMEEEGIYYFFASQGGKEKMVLADGVSAHQPIPGDAKVPYRTLEAAGHMRQIDHVFELSSGEAVTSGKVTLRDYSFERPGADLTTSKAMPKGSHGGKDHEIYDYPGHYRDIGEGERRARVRMEAEAARHKAVRGAGTIPSLGVGQTFDLVDHPRRSENASYMLTRVVHHMRLTGADEPPLGVTELMGPAEGFADATDLYRVSFEALPKDEQYRAPLRTPWPDIAGVHTAVVTGPSGEEIHPDKYGRVKVQFHWDRIGARDEYSSCWCRFMMPWTGKNWGMIAVPRIGQEVVVQFEEGNPDRPLVIGMLYNAETMPPYVLPDQKNETGIVTRSTKGGGSSEFHELMFRDTKGEELVRFQSQRDYRQIVKNDAEITVGLEHKDKGDMSLTVHHDLTETVKTGDHSFKVETGSQTIDIKTDKTETIEGKSTQTVTGDVKETVKTGNVTRDVDTGNETVTIKLGNYALETSLGKIGNKAMQEIKLEVGANSITINQMGVTIKGMMVNIEGSAMLEAKAPMSTVKGDGLLILKGGLTMIN